MREETGAGAHRGPAVAVFGRAVRLALRAHPVGVATLVLCTVTLGATPVGTAWLTKLLVDGMTARGPAANLLAVAAGLASAMAVSEILPEVTAYLERELDRRIEQEVLERIGAKLQSIGGVRLFEQPRFHDIVQLGLDSGRQAPHQILSTGVGIAQQAVTVCGFVGVLLTIDPLLAALAVASATPALVAERRLGARRMALVARLSPPARRRAFFRTLLTEPQAAKEIRLFNIGGYLQRRMLHEVDGIQRAERALDRRTLRTRAALGGVAVATWVAALGYVAARVGSGGIGAGDVVAFLGSVVGLTTGLASLFGGLAHISSTLVAMSFYERLLAVPADIRPGSGQPAPSLRVAVELRDVWFRYDESLPWVLRGIDLRIPAGGSLGLVGANGAGKSTVVKLLCRLYEPERGAVLWDGVDIRRYEPASLRERIGSVFQDFMRYELTVAENVGLGDVDRLDDQARIERAAAAVNLGEAVSALPKGWHTVLSRRFGGEDPDATAGAELSGGQWQRLALARMLMRDDRDLMILDEPSSGLDPRAEHELHTVVHTVADDRARLLISHRLNTVRAADRIAVLADGRIVEEGRHDDLMRAGGVYAGLFTLQASGYAGAAEDAR
jgi:ATP-binding cassette, subfamily B, bacterial